VAPQEDKSLEHRRDTPADRATMPKNSAAPTRNKAAAYISWEIGRSWMPMLFE
jgi:hypothetical protein